MPDANAANALLLSLLLALSAGGGPCSTEKTTQVSASGSVRAFNCWPKLLRAQQRTRSARSSRGGPLPQTSACNTPTD